MPAEKENILIIQNRLSSDSLLWYLDTLVVTSLATSVPSVTGHIVHFLIKPLLPGGNFFQQLLVPCWCSARHSLKSTSLIKAWPTEGGIAMLAPHSSGYHGRKRKFRQGFPEAKVKSVASPFPELYPAQAASPQKPPCDTTPTCTSHFTCGGKWTCELPARWSFNIYLGLYASAAWKVRWIKQVMASLNHSDQETHQSHPGLSHSLQPKLKFKAK